MKYDLSKYISWDFCDGMVTTILDSFSSLRDICFLLCGLFALVYFANILMKTWAKGESFDFNELLKPFIIGVVIMNFNLVYGLIDQIVEPITLMTEGIAEEQKTKLQAKQTEYETKVTRYEEEKQRIIDEKEYDTFDKVSQFFDNFGYYATETLMDGVEIILSIIYSALKISIRVFNISFRVILIVLGPIAFALSLIPYFKDNWKNWIAKYINVCLYLVVAATIDVIIYKFRDIMLDIQISKYDEALKQISASGDFFGLDAPFEASVITSVFMLIFVAMYLIIPSIVNMIVEKGETAGVQAGLAASMIGTGKIGAAAAMKAFSLSSMIPRVALGKAKQATSGTSGGDGANSGSKQGNNNGAIMN